MSNEKETWLVEVFSLFLKLSIEDLKFLYGLLRKMTGENRGRQLENLKKFLCSQVSIANDDSIIIRKTLVDCNCTLRETLDTTDLVQKWYGIEDNDVPRATVVAPEIVFFKTEPWECTNHCFLSHEDLERAFAQRDLNPADPVSVANENKKDPLFADKNPNSTHWQDSKGKWCSIIFDCRDGQRTVSIVRSGGWEGFGWWFAGVYKSA
jgi:hypothetical protein